MRDDPSAKHEVARKLRALAHRLDVGDATLTMLWERHTAPEYNDIRTIALNYYPDDPEAWDGEL